MKVEIPDQKKVIAFYGSERQTGIHMEECAELIQAISKMRRVENDMPEERRRVYRNLVEEIADVLISIKQLMQIHEIAWSEVQDMVDRKCRRQEMRMDDAIRRSTEG